MNTSIDFSDLIGIPFSEKNINGINCHELMRKAHARFQIDIPVTDIAVCASRSVSNAEIENKIKEQWVTVEKPVIPCGVLIASSNPMFAHHIATYIGNNKILHITKNTNSIIENLFPKYKTRIIGFYRFVSREKGKNNVTLNTGNKNS